MVISGREGSLWEGMKVYGEEFCIKWEMRLDNISEFPKSNILFFEEDLINAKTNKYIKDSLKKQANFLSDQTYIYHCWLPFLSHI